MAFEPSRPVRQAAFALVVVAATATELAAADGRSVAWGLGVSALGAALAGVIKWRIPAPDERRTPPLSVLLLLVGLAATAFVFEPWRRRWTGEGYPLEIQMVLSLRNVGLGLAAFSCWRLCMLLACVVSLFLMLFAVSLSNHSAVVALLALYAATGCVWLMLTYWTGLQRALVGSEGAALEGPQRSARPPWLAVFLVVGVVGGVVALLAIGPQRAVRVLGEWLPTSGGTGAFDPFSRGGVNDGDDEISGQNARSTGMTPTDTFLDSPLPSLYDMANERYGEPFKPKDQERAVALDQQTKIQEGNKPPADNLRPNREFPTARKSPRQPRESSDRAARALFEVQGRTPLHVRVTAFDTFDGQAWQEAPVKLPGCSFDKEADSCWMKVLERSPSAIFSAGETHRFKITSPLGSLVPTPPHLTRFRVGRVNQPAFFGWGQDCILRMAERKTPAGIVVETECRTIDPRFLDVIEFPSVARGERFHYADLPLNLNREVAVLAHQWADGLPKGWRQIAAVVEHLRTEYIVDPTARVPEDCRDPLGHFLLHSRRGPDYQFATAAAVMLRVLGYSTRVVTGFYVSPEHYDPETQHTPVVQEDLHFWTEVMLPGNEWLVIEPTPG
jgi:transglutaminase-like putative cysteine protease